MIPYIKLLLSQKLPQLMLYFWKHQKSSSLHSEWFQNNFKAINIKGDQCLHIDLINYLSILICLWIEQRTVPIRLSYCYLKYKDTTIYRIIDSNMWYICPSTQTITFMYMRTCYESPKKEIVSHTFEHLIYNLKTYNRVKDINSMGT